MTRYFGPVKKLLSITAVAGLLLVLGAGQAAAQDVEIEVDHPTHVAVGEEVDVVVTITAADGSPVVGSPVDLSFVGRLLGESGYVVVASAGTDEHGEAHLHYTQRALDAGKMRVEYFGPQGTQSSDFEVDVVDGPQLVTSEAGADLPMFGVWWIVVLLVIIWIMIIMAALGIMHIGRWSDKPEGPARFVPRFAVGWIVFTALGMFVVLLTRDTSHANLSPTEPYDRVPGAVVGEESDYIGLGLSEGMEVREALEGKQIFVRAGCASCHGLGGAVRSWPGHWLQLTNEIANHHLSAL